jgi:hypothetical protein
MKRALGVVLLLAGVALACRIAYEFIEGGFDAKILFPFAFPFALCTVGLMWLRGTRPPTREDVPAESTRTSLSEPILHISRYRDDSFPENDLGQVSFAGWRLALFGTAVTLGVSITGVMLVNEDPKDFEVSDWRTLLMIGAGCAAGYVVFQCGKRILWLCGLTVRSQRPLREPPDLVAGQFGGPTKSSNEHPVSTFAEKEQWRGERLNG